MAPCNDFSRRPQRVASALELDFRKGFCEADFSMMLGSDGSHSTDGDGLTVNSALFQVTQPVGEHGWLDHYKWCAYYRTPVECHRSKETIFEAKISNKQIFDETNPFPLEYRPSIQDMYADPRLAHGQFGIIDPESGVQAGFVLTDHMLYGVYGRRPAFSICTYKNCYADECEPCEGSCTSAYGCNDFWQDCRYQDFKQNTTEPQFRSFVEFVPWVEFCKANSVKINNFKVFCSWRKQNPMNCDAYTRQDYVAWKSQYTWQEYCAFQEGWKEWYHQYKDWEACSDACMPESCAGGECSTRLFGGSSGAAKKAGCSCYHVYTRDGRSCYDENTTRGVEDYSYQYGRSRSCCNPTPASFVELIPLMRTEACDPLCDFIKVAVGIDRKYKTLKFYVNNQELFKVVDIGRRLNDEFRVIEHGGYAEVVDVRCVLLAFGTGSMLDASLPNNYSRYHAKNNQVDETALIPLMHLEKYHSTYANKLGEYRPKEAGHFASVSNEMKYRAFHQGDVFKIQYVCVLVRSATRDYPSLKSYCQFNACCGPRNRDACSTRECCEDDEVCCVDTQCEHDERDYNVEFITKGGAGPVVGDNLEAPDNYTAAPKTVTAKLVRTPRSKRYWQPQCGDAVWGDSPY